MADTPSPAQEHFRLLCSRVLASMLDQLRRAGRDDLLQPEGNLGFLARYTLPAGGVPALDADLARLEAEEGVHLPLATLGDDAPLLVTVGLIEEDIRLGALFATLQDPLAYRRPCVGVVGWLLARPDDPDDDVWPALRRLLDGGFLVVENPNDPRSEWVLRVPHPIWDALRGHPSPSPAPGMEHVPRDRFPDLDALIFSDDVLAQVAALPALMADGRFSALVVRGMRGSGRRTLIGSVARALGRDLLVFDGIPADDRWRILWPLSTVTGSVPVVRANPAPGETLKLPATPCFPAPVGLALGRTGGVDGPALDRALTVSLPPPGPAARRRFWLAAGLPAAPGALDEITDRFLLTGGHIARATSLAVAQAALGGRRDVVPADVAAATRALNRQALETLATPLPAIDRALQTIVGEGTARELRTLEQRCRHREALRERTGAALGATLNRGVRALFKGPSGTGKTLAARALAAALSMDVYRVDLAAVVNKYIGETERNLDKVLSTAEELDVVLLLDEGDALMARRTEVSNANDRYANLETNFLLQRLETYEGIVIVTTNAGSRIDSAFLRRIDVTIDFAPPTAYERRMILELHLPPGHAVAPDLLDDIARRCDITGGQIRNAALHATLLALGNGAVVGDHHLHDAIRREYRRAGDTCPLRPAPTPNETFNDGLSGSWAVQA